MKNKITSSWSTAFLIFALFLGFSCRKMELQAPVAVTPVRGNADTVVQKFFSITGNIDPVITAIRNNILQQQAQKPFVEKFVNYGGYPVWDKAVIKNAEENTTSNSITQRGGDQFKMAFIPLAAANDSVIKAILKVRINGNDTSFKMLYRWQYNQYGYGKVKQHNNARQTALLFMGFENYVFGHKDFKINDTLLFKEKGKEIISDTIHINSFNTGITTAKMELITITICYDKQVKNDPPVIGTLVRARSNIVPCDCHTVEVCQDYNTWIETSGGGGGDDDGGGTPPATPPGTGGGGSGGGGNWNDDPCAPSGGGDPGTPIPPTRLTQMAPPCDGSGGDDDPWVPVPIEDEPTDRDANGYLYSRIAELQSILEDFPQALEPCDSLNIMPLETYGAMWQNVAQFTPSQDVRDRIDSIRNALPGWIVDDYNIQSLTEASGAIVNCDYFPVRITQMPTGYTPESLLEYFRTHINSFIDPNLGMSFWPYYQGTVFNDSQKFYAPYDASIGSLWHLVLGSAPGRNGSVVESGYSHVIDGSYQSHYFTVSTMETVIDFEHPVAGNRRWGIFSDPDHPGEFDFYTMGVDRIWDDWFSIGDWINHNLNGDLTGFQKADQLWSSLQSKMANFIIDHGGHAEYYSSPSIKARPFWEDVSEYLKGNIDFLTLKQRLGC